MDAKLSIKYINANFLMIFSDFIPVKNRDSCHIKESGWQLRARKYFV